MYEKHGMIYLFLCIECTLESEAGKQRSFAFCMFYIFQLSKI